jgi:multidrug efflux pump subunit AcrA (membrane-fusion protein)
MILGGMFFAGMKQKPPKVTVKVQPKTVKVRPVVYSDIETSIISYGRVTSSHPIDLIAEVSGRILPGQVSLKEGQDFRKGSLLFRIEDSESRFDLKSQKSNFLRDLATILPDLKIDFPDSYPQWNSYFASIDIDKTLPEIPQFKSDKEKTFLATKNILSNYFSIKRAETNLRKHLIYAPFSGSFSQVMFEPGAYVNPGNKIGRIIRRGKLELQVPVEASDIGWVNKGSKAMVSSEDGLLNWEGRVTRIGDVVNQTTQSIDVTIEIIPNQHPVYDGLYLKAEIPGITIADAMEVNRSAVYQGSLVYTVVEDSVLKVRPINTKRLNSKTVVFNGLEAGEQLIVDQLINGHNNMIVNPVLDTTGSVSSSAALSNNSN